MFRSRYFRKCPCSGFSDYTLYPPQQAGRPRISYSESDDHDQRPWPEAAALLSGL